MSRSVTCRLLAAIAASATACSDSPVVPLDERVTVAVAAGDGQIAVANSLVAIRPALFLADVNQRPIRGATVVFKVRSGDGSVSGPSATTDSLGIATVGGWLLGKTAGENTLLAIATGADSVIFTATAISGPAAQLTKAYTTLLTGTVGSVVAMPPAAVHVADVYGNSVSGTRVTFAVSGGGGSATGLAAVTDSSGKAGVGAWTLGTVAGPNALTATVNGLPSVTLTVLGLAASPASITKQAGDGQRGSVSAPVDTAPAVLVKDVYGNPVSNAFVTFAVVSGGGEIVNDYQVTDRTGTATVIGWMLGPLPGTNTLSASVADLLPVFFTATAEDPYKEASSYTMGSSITGSFLYETAGFLPASTQTSARSPFPAWPACGSTCPRTPSLRARSYSMRLEN